MNDWLYRIDLPDWVNTLLLAFAVIVLIRLVLMFIKRRIDRAAIERDRYRTKKILDFVSYVLIALIILTIYSQDLAGITVVLGVAGAGVAFALQEVIASFAGWLALMFGSFYRTGDRVQLGGIKGDVIDIGVLRTTLMEIGEWVDGDLYSGRIVRVANSFVFKEPVFNYSGDFPFLWDEIKIPIRHGSDYDLAKKIIEKISNEYVLNNAKEGKEVWKKMVRKYLIEDAQLEPMISMTVNDNWVELTLRYIVNYKQRRLVKSNLWSALLAEIEKTEGKVQIGSATIQIINPS